MTVCDVFKLPKTSSPTAFFFDLLDKVFGDGKVDVRFE